MNDPVAVRPRFDYGKHETFPVRHGWLAKGLRRIEDVGAFRGDLETADVLGLGSRMAKSLQFWLEAGGLAKSVYQPTPGSPGVGRRVKVWRITDFGRAVYRYDPYLEFPATWWFVHLALARRERSVWGWFFNDFAERNFTRRVCTEAFRTHAERHATNPPSLALAQREIACLLQAYSGQEGSAIEDPEDATACPLRELQLVVRHYEVDRYEKTQPIDSVPVEAFLACASALVARTGADSVSFSQLVHSRFGPRRMLGLGIDRLESVAEQAAEAHAGQGVQVTMLGAERHLVLPSIALPMWFEAHFRRVGLIGR